MLQFLVYSQGCAIINPKEILSISSHVPFPLPTPQLPPQTLAATNPPSVPVDLSILDISRNLNHTLCGFLYDFFHSVQFSRFIYVVVCVWYLIIFTCE